MEMIKIGEDIPIVQNIWPVYAWNCKFYLCELGLLFFTVEGENEREDGRQSGPFRIQMQLFEYQTHNISTILEIRCGT